MPVSPFIVSKRRYGHIFLESLNASKLKLMINKSDERGKEKQMRSLVMMNRIIVINRPAICGFNFSCLQAPHFDQKAIAGKEENDKDWDRNRYRYRRY